MPNFFTVITGLGGMIVEFANNFATAKLFVPVIVIALVGILLTELVSWLERRLSGWRISERERFSRSGSIESTSQFLLPLFGNLRFIVIDVAFSY